MRIKLKGMGLFAGFGALLAMVYLLVPTTPTAAAQSCIGSGASCNVSTTVNLTITQWDICIGSEGTFNFDPTMISSTQTTVNGAFSGNGHFYVDDLRGADKWYYTTVQMSGALVGPNGASIPAANVSMKTPTTGPGGITLLAGTTNSRVVVNAGMANYQTLETPKNLIQRDTATNFGVIGKYGVLPQMQVIIPAYQSVGQYTGTLVFTLHENP